MKAARAGRPDVWPGNACARARSRRILPASKVSDVGSRNVAFAEKFLSDEGIALVGGDVRGVYPRRIQYWPASGRARQIELPATDRITLVEREIVEAKQVRAHERNGESDVELF